VPVTVTEIHRVDERGSRRVAEVYPPEDRVTPVCVHSTDPEFAGRILGLDVIVRQPAPFLDAPPQHRPDEGDRHRERLQPNHFTTVGVRETVDALLAGLPRDGVPRYEVRQRVRSTKY
jgi:hypothetical protein